MEYLAIILITLLSGVIGTGLGGLIGGILRRESNKIVSLLLSFAAGIMLAVVCFDLMSRPITMMRKGLFPPYTPIIVVISVIFGYCVIYLLNFLIDKFADGRSVHSNDKNNDRNLLITGLIMMIAIALHNLPEGMVIGASYALEPDLLANLFTGSGFIMAIVIGLHNIPEGMAISVPLISGGMGKIKAVLLTALSGLPTVLGAILGYALGGINDVMLTLSLGFASGAMLYVVFGELLPESLLMWKSKLPAFSLFIGLLTGFLLVIF
ncbi:MAG: ZIP family metal transporter [Clostridia bacterium]|nr:ZIP family metal transporter [Clostridia bacterium]